MTETGTDVRGQTAPPFTHNTGEEQTDPLIDRLAREHAAFINSLGDYELEALDLPRKVDSDEDVKAVSKMVAEIRKTARAGEASRKKEKDDYLQAGKKIDNFFNGVKDRLEAMAKEIEQRCGPYLAAKDARERREREERERIAREEADRKRQEEAAARRREEEARAAQERARRDLAEAADRAARDAAEERLRESKRVEREARADANMAGKAAGAQTRVADSHARAADSDVGRLSRVQGEGAAATVRKVWRGDIQDWAAVRRTLGPLGTYINDATINSALQSAINGGLRALDGARIFEDDEVRTTTTRRN